MRYKLELTLNGCKQVLHVISDNFKNWRVWKVKFQDGGEAILFKCGNIWMQRNEDDLDRGLLNAIGEKIDHINLGLALS